MPAWIAAVRADADDLPGLGSFAAGLEHDLDAVTRDLTTHWSSGPIESRVNHIKMVKRQMFGRAGLPPLRKRVLLGIDHALRELLGQGSGICLEIGCGTGVHAARVRQLGWTPVGVDLSAGMLRHAGGRLTLARADAGRLPIRDGAVPAAIAVLVHTNMPGYPAVLSEVARVLRPGGVLVHVGVHPCFCGSFADRSDLDAVVIRSGYLDGHWTKASWTDQGVRDKVGATHRPLPELLHAFLDAGLRLERFAEGGAPTPAMLAIRARKPR